MERMTIRTGLNSNIPSQLQERLNSDARKFASLDTFEGHTFYLLISGDSQVHNRASLAKRIDQFKGVAFFSSNPLNRSSVSRSILT